jgi:hypothetical protein
MSLGPKNNNKVDMSVPLITSKNNNSLPLYSIGPKTPGKRSLSVSCSPLLCYTETTLLHSKGPVVAGMSVLDSVWIPSKDLSSRLMVLRRFQKHYLFSMSESGGSIQNQQRESYVESLNGLKYIKCGRIIL